jgi:hypothetical protein
MSDILISSLVRSQLPDFIRGEYPLFITFLEKYYEWTQNTTNVLAQTGELANANDIDLSSEFYLNELKKELLPFFPVDTALDKRKFLRFATEYYKSKGTVNSIKFLFRALFNENIDIYLPKDDIFKASDGRWALPLALRIDTADLNIFNISKTLLTGVTSKSTAVVETVIKSVDRQLGISYIEVYVSNVNKLFETGETVYATYYNGTTPITVTGRLIGALSQIEINPLNRGLYYNVGDPVSIVGGLNPTSNTPVGAIATVGEVTNGSITDISVKSGGFGFRDPMVSSNASIIVFRGGFDNISSITEAVASVELIDSSFTRTMNVSNTLIETIFTSNIASLENNAINTVSTLQTFNVYSISHVVLSGQGGGYIREPETDVLSLYGEDLVSLETLLLSGVNISNNSTQFTSASIDLTTLFAVGDYFRIAVPARYEAIRFVESVTATTVVFDRKLENSISNANIYSFYRRRLDKLGSLGRLSIVTGGSNYAVNDVLTFTGGTGYGANAKVTSVDNSNSNTILSVAFIQPANNQFIIGGEGYSSEALPTVTVTSANGANAVIVVTEINGDGEDLDLSTSRIGSITKLKISSYGYDYISTPSISLRNADLTIANVTVGQTFSSNVRLYQGASNTLTSFTAYVDRFISSNNSLRIFDYKGTLNNNLPLISDDGLVSANVVSGSITYYGNGLAKANATFENGLIRYPGIYLNTEGFLNWDKKLQDAVRYNNFTYAIKSNYDYKFYKNTVSNIIHPAGMKAFATRIETHVIGVQGNANVILVTAQTMANSFNIANGSNVMTMNTTANLANTVNVGDVVILTGVSRQISGTINISGNNVVGTNTNFINDLYDGDTIYLGSGNTTFVANVISANNLITSNIIYVTANNTTINVVYNEVRTVTGVSGNTIIVDTNFRTNSNSVITTLEKR